MHDAMASILQRDLPADEYSFGRIAFLGNYLPRQCGIATFTTHLCESIAARYCETNCIALPVTDIADGYRWLETRGSTDCCDDRR